MAKFNFPDIVEVTTQPPPAYRLKKGDLCRIHRSGLGSRGDRVEVVRITGAGEEFISAVHPEHGRVWILHDERWFEEA